MGQVAEVVKGVRVHVTDLDKGSRAHPAAPGQGVSVRAPMRCGTSGAAHRVHAKVPGLVGWCAPGAVADIAVRTTVASIVIRCAPE
ncbi:hypothetical protein GCM10010293_62320 [Streptomyces griseoflavus]|nr:hypothetical protein GCM10010293_62320 [Streptomyces griseoflavus]